MPRWSMSAGFKILTKAAVPSAFYDYHGHEFDLPRCHENTRVAVRDKIGEWVLAFKLAVIIMWLYGAAGAGLGLGSPPLLVLCLKSFMLGGSYSLPSSFRAQIPPEIT